MNQSDPNEVRKLNEALQVMHKRCDDLSSEVSKLRAARTLPAFNPAELLARVERRVGAELERLRAVILETPSERTADKAGATWPRSMLMEHQAEFYALLERVRTGEALGDKGRAFADMAGHAVALSLSGEATREHELSRLRKHMAENADEREANAYANGARAVYVEAKAMGLSTEQATALSSAVRAAHAAPNKES